MEVAADAARVWDVVGDFGGFNHFIPALEHIEMTGEGVRSLRKKFFRDGQNLVVEQLNSRDDQAMHMTWTLIYNTLGIDNLWAAMRVEPLADNRCRATWTIIADHTDAHTPAGFRDFLQGFADEAMGNVQGMFPRHNLLQGGLETQGHHQTYVCGLARESGGSVSAMLTGWPPSRAGSLPQFWFRG